MASLFNTKISNSYVGLIKTIDSAVISASLRELSDGLGNGSGIHINNAGDLKVTNILEWGTLKDTGENISITKFVDEADGIASNDNDTTIPTSAAVVDYVASRITLEDLDFSGDSGTGSVDLDSQTFAVVGTANEIETSAGSQQLQIGLPTNIVIAGTTTFGGNLIGNSNIILKDNSARTLAAFYAGGKSEIYFNDSKKFETTSDGATVTGGLTATGGSVFTGATFSSNVDFSDSAKARFGTDNDLEIYNDGSDAYYSNTTGDMYFINKADDKDIIFQSDNGSGGYETYFKLDGSHTTILANKNIHFDDNVKAVFGNYATPDLEIYHDASNSYIADTGTGELRIKSQSLRLQGSDGSDLIQADEVGGVRLYDNGSQKLEVGSSGAVVTGTVTADGLVLGDNDSITMGDAGDFSLKHDGSNSKIENNTGHFNIIQEADNSDITFFLDDGSGGSTTYLQLDGGIESILTYKDILMAVDGDGGKLKFGASQDLQIYHDGSHSYIEDTGTGDLRIKTNGTAIALLGNSNEDSLLAYPNGAIKLFYDNSLKLETTATGVTITGVAVADGLDMGDNEKIRLGDSQDLEIYHDGTESFIENSTGDLWITSTGDDLVLQGADDVDIKVQGGEMAAKFGGNGGVDLYHDNSKKFETTSTGISVTGSVVASGSDTATLSETGLTLSRSNSYIQSDADNADTLNIGQSSVRWGHLKVDTTTFKVLNGGNERLGIDSSGNASFAQDVTISGDLTVNGTTTTVNTDHFNVEDPLISMAKDNAANTVDIGFYGRYNDGTQRYTGLFMDASSGTEVYRLFKGVTAEPTTTVNISGTGYQAASLIIDGLTAVNATFTGADTLNIADYILHDGDADTKFGFPSANTFKIRTGGTDALNIDSSQNATFAGRTHLADTKYATYGGTNSAWELEIGVTGDNAYITKSATTSGHLYIKNNGTDKNIYLQTDNGSGSPTTYIKCDGLSNYTEFPVDARFMDDIKLQFGDSNDSDIYHNGNDMLFRNHKAAGDMSFNADSTGSGGSATSYFWLDGGVVKTRFAKEATFGDNVKLTFGNVTTPDLQIYHDGNDSYITDTGTGLLFIRGSSAIRLQGANGESSIDANEDGAVNLYYDNSKKFETTSAGATLTGALSITGDGSNAATLTETGAGLLTIATVDDLVLDADNDLILDAGGNDIRLKVDGVEYGKFKDDSDDLAIFASIQDKDIIFKGNDGGSTITALTLDMSEAGAATFNSNITLLSRITFDYNGSGTGNNYLETGTNTLSFKASSGTSVITTNFSTLATTFSGSVHLDSDSAQLQLGDDNDLQMYHNGANGFINNGTGDFTIQSSDEFVVDAAGEVILDSGSSEIHLKGSGTLFGKFFKSSDNFYINQPIDDKDIIFSGLDNGSSVTALTLDMSNAGAATFNNNITAGGILTTNGGAMSINNGGSLSAYFYGSGTSYTQGAIVISSDTSDSPEARGQGVFMFNEGKDSTWYMGTRYNNADEWQIGRVAGASLDTAAATTGNAIVKVKQNGETVITGSGDGNSPILSVTDTTDTEVAWFTGNRAGDTGAYIAIQHLPSTAAESNRSGIKFQAKDDGDNTTTYASLIQYISDYTGGTEDGIFTVNTMTNGSVTEKMKFLPTGEIVIGQGSSNAGFLDFDGTNLQFNTQRNPNTGSFVDSNKSHAHIGLQGINGGSKIVFGTAAANNTTATTRMVIDGSGHIVIGTTTYSTGSKGKQFESNPNTVDLKSSSSGTGTEYHQEFANPNSTVGSITTNGSATAFNTSSDYRLKEDLKDFDGLDKVSKISVYDYKWKVDDSRGYGVLAHELDEVLPQAVAGEKDGKKMQSVDYSKIVPLLVKSIQELKAEIEELKKK